MLRRAGQTEGSVDLARLAGFKPAGVICEIMNDDGTMARLPGPGGVRQAARHQDRHHRRPDPVPAAQGEARATRIAEASACPPVAGEFRAVVYENGIDHVDHVALVKGEPEFGPDDEVLVRVHMFRTAGASGIGASRLATASHNPRFSRACRAYWPTGT